MDIIESSSEITQKVATIFRAARKACGLNQHAISEAMGVSQGTISKFESALLVPDMIQWYQFCATLKLDPKSTYQSGLIHFKSNKKQKQKHKFKVGKIKSPLLIKASEIAPLARYILKSEHHLKFKKYLKDHLIDADLFYTVDIKIPIDIVITIENFMHENQLEKVNAYADMFQSNAYSSIQTIKKYASKKNEYCNIYNYSVDSNKISIARDKNIYISEKEKLFLDKLEEFKINETEYFLKNIVNSKDVFINKIDETKTIDLTFEV